MRVLATLAVAGATLVLLGGCSSGHPAAPIGSGGGSTATSPATVPASGAAPSAAPTGTATGTPASMADACAAFGQFYDDLHTRGPADVGRLRAEAQAVQQAAGDGAAFGDPTDAAFLDDASALLDYVDQPDFPATGSVTADPVQEVLQDCS